MSRIIIIWIRNNFGFSKTEANAYLVLMVILIGLQLWPSKFSIFSTKVESPVYLDSLTRLLYPEVATDSSHDLTTTAVLSSDTSHPQKVESEQVPKKKYAFQSVEPMDLNQVDSTWLMKIYGIGPVLSKRIIKYRNLLGGFYSLDQLQEVYHLPEEVIETLKSHVFIDLRNMPVEKIGLNTMEFMQIASHPYISFNLARAIVSYRKQHGPFTTPEDLKKIHLMDDSTYLRVLPYIDF